MIRFLMEIKMLSQKEIEIRTDLINGLKKQEVHRYSDRLVNQSVTYYLENCTSLEEFTDTLKNQSFLRHYRKSVVYGNILKDSLLEISDLQDMYNITVEDNQEDKKEIMLEISKEDIKNEFQTMKRIWRLSSLSSKMRSFDRLFERCVKNSTPQQEKMLKDRLRQDPGAKICLDIYTGIRPVNYLSGEQAKIALDDFSKTLDIIKSFAKEQGISL